MSRFKKVQKAVRDEINRVNEAITNGCVAIIDTHAGIYTIDRVTFDFWYISHPALEDRDVFNVRSWCGCNDGTWDYIMKQLNLPRNSLFK